MVSRGFGIAQKTLIAGVLLLTAALVPAVSAETDSGPHEAIKLEKGRFQSPAEDGWVAIDNVSDYCLECHGDSGAEGAAAAAPKASHELSGMGQSHPVEIEFPTDREGYRPAEGLDERLVLVDGLMTCLTCHSPSPDRAPVIPQDRSQLCVACHER